MDEVANDDEIDCTIQKAEDGQYVIKLDIDPEFYRFLIGKAGETKKRLQQETGAMISIPQKFELHTGISTYHT
jgi:polyribonucleotide nucleotidyltransferase